MRPFLLLALTLVTGLAACTDESAPAEEKPPAPSGSYEFDSATGETLARFEDDDGVVTTMRSGAQVPLVLPSGFTLYPDAQVKTTTRVERGDFTLLTTVFESADEPASVAAHYRREAADAGFAIEVDLDSDTAVTVTARSVRGDTLSLIATRETGATSAQLSIATRSR